MEPPETAFETALWRSRNQRARIARQREMIVNLQEMGLTHLLPAAHALLRKMEGVERMTSERLRLLFSDQRRT